MNISVVVVLSLLAACALDTATSEQNLCTITDQEAGTCPPGGLTIWQWTQQTQQQQANTQLPGQTPVELGSSCSDGVCTAEWNFNTVWGQARLITSCNSCECETDLCWVGEPCFHVAPGPGCQR